MNRVTLAPEVFYMNLWQYLGCQDDEEKAQLVRGLSDYGCAPGGRCGTDLNCHACWYKVIDRVKEVKLYGEGENDVNDN